MIESMETDDDPRPPLKLETSRALADIGYDSVIAQEHGTSSEDEAKDTLEVPDDETQSAIGVSIGREQTRLTSPKTPAVEKAAAIDRAGGFFQGFDSTESTLVEEPEADLDERDIENDKRATSGPTAAADVDSGGPAVQLPSPWKAEPNAQSQTNEKRKSGLLDGLFNRRRASSGPDTTLISWQKSILSSLPTLTALPSLPKPFSSSSPSTTSATDDTSTNATPDTKPEATDSQLLNRARTRTSNRNRSESDGVVRELSRRVSIQTTDSIAPAKPPLQSSNSQGGLLRRSTSDNSLMTQRTLSLGDDSRFENVSDQVNNRFKAIRDSFQDSNIKMPSMPNFSVSSFTPDFVRARAGSYNRKQSTQPAQGGVLPQAGNTTSKSFKPVDPITRQPCTSDKAAKSDAPKPESHPKFARALEQLEGDVVVLGGYRGSILREARPPHRRVWVPVKVGLNLRKVNLELGLEEDYDERATDHIIPGGMLTHIGPVDIARRLFKRLRACENARAGKLSVHDYGYDWRLMPSYLSQQLIEYLERLPCNRFGVPRDKRGATVIAHSLGGLITRHAVNERPDLFRGVVYAGVPHTCVNILGPLRNGDEVLLSDRVLTAQVNFTIRTSFALLPLDGRCFFDKQTGEEYPVDFFDAQTWIDNCLSPCVGKPLPPLNAQPKPTGLTGYVSSVANALPSLPLPGRKGNVKPRPAPDPSKTAITGGAEVPDMSTSESGTDGSNSVRTAVTIPKDKAVEYLQRTLASIKAFKEDLSHDRKLAATNRYPPIAVIYGKTTPTVYGAKVNGREGIRCADAYDELAFASGDGVVLARAAMVPKGYVTARGGIVASDRGHVTLLGDLEAVGRCLNAVIGARKRGVGCGNLDT